MIYNSHFSNLFNHLKWFMQKCLPINLRASCCRIIFSIFCFWEATGAVVMYPVSLVSVSVPATFLDGMKKPNWIHCVIAQIVLGFATTAIKSVSAAILTRLFGFVIIFCGFTTFFFSEEEASLTLPFPPTRSIQISCRVLNGSLWISWEQCVFSAHKNHSWGWETLIRKACASIPVTKIKNK